MPHPADQELANAMLTPEVIARAQFELEHIKEQAIHSAQRAASHGAALYAHANYTAAFRAKRFDVWLMCSTALLPAVAQKATVDVPEERDFGMGSIMIVHGGPYRVISEEGGRLPDGVDLPEGALLVEQGGRRFLVAPLEGIAS